MCGYVSFQAGSRLASGTAWRRWAAMGAGVLATLLYASTAQATHDTCVVNGHANTIVHTVGTFKANSKRGDFLTDWIDISEPNAWTCTRVGHDAKSHTLTVFVKAIIPNSAVVIVADRDITVDGKVFTIFKTTPDGSKHMLGYIMERRYRITSDAPHYDWTSDWLPARHDNVSGQHIGMHQLTLPNGTQYRVSFESRIRLLKWNIPHAPPTSFFPRTGEPVLFTAVKWYYYPGQLSPLRTTDVRVWFNREDTTCTTPLHEKTVSLEHVLISEFGHVGSTAKPKWFRLELTNCSDAVKEIKYRLTPVRISNHPLDGPGCAPNCHPFVRENPPWGPEMVHVGDNKGVLPLGTGSTAQGVRIQILDDSGNPVRFSHNHTEHLMNVPYSKGSGVASILLQARYIKTSDTVTAGSVKAVMSVLYMYK